jgi:hypothetical protein
MASFEPNITNSKFEYYNMVMLKIAHFDEVQMSHMYQGNSNNCGPCSAAIVLNALINLLVTGNDLSTELNSISWRGIIPVVRRIPNWATFPWGLVDLFNNYGIRSRWKIFSKQTDLLSAVVGGKTPIVIIGVWRQRWSHYKILAAYDEKLGFGFIDPGSRSSNISWQREDEFLSQWRFLFNSIIEVDNKWEFTPS